jgi:hypothetical protein
MTIRILYLRYEEAQVSSGCNAVDDMYVEVLYSKTLLI